jgi:hypothetical protein
MHTLRLNPIDLLRKTFNNPSFTFAVSVSHLSNPSFHSVPRDAPTDGDAVTGVGANAHTLAIQ